MFFLPTGGPIAPDSFKMANDPDRTNFKAARAWELLILSDGVSANENLAYSYGKAEAGRRASGRRHR